MSIILRLKYKKLSSLDLPSLAGPPVKQHAEHYRSVKRVSKNQFICTVDTYSSAYTVHKYGNSDDMI